MVKQKGDVSSIDPPHDVDRVTDERHRADDAVQCYIRKHAGDQKRRCAESPRLVHDIQGKAGRDDISDRRHKTDQRVDPETDIGAWHKERRIEKRRERVEPRDPLRA